MKNEEKIKTELEAEKDQIEEEDLSTPEKMVDLVQVDPLEIELGYSLIPLVDKAQGGDLLDRIKKSRRQIVLEFGLIVPQVRITDNMQLEPDEYVVKLNGAAIGGSKLKLNRLLALNTGGSEAELEGEKTTEPVFQLPAFWIGEDLKEEAEKKGFTVFDGPTVVATHLTELIKRHAGSVMGRKEVKGILDSVNKRNPVLIEELNKLNIKTGDVQKVLQDLLNEGISIRSIDTLLEVICDYHNAVSNREQLVELVRASLKRQISAKHADQGKNLHCLILSPDLEKQLLSLASETEAGYSLPLSPEALNRMLERMGEKVNAVREKGHAELLICDPLLRRPLKMLLQRNFPRLSVLSFNEVAEGYTIDMLETV